MKTFASALLLFAALTLSMVARAAPLFPAQADNVREAVFRVLFVRARAVVPEAKVYILEKETHHPPEWGNMSDFDLSPELLTRFSNNVPHVSPVSQSGGGASATEEWHEDKNHVHGPLLQIVSLHWFSNTSVEAETDIDAGMPRLDISRPYLVTLQQGQWTAREDVRTEWWQAVHESGIREAVVRYELAQGIYGAKPGNTPCYLSFGAYTDALRVDPPEAFLARFAGEPVRLRKASLCPVGGSLKPWMMIGVQHVRWISDTEAEVDGGGTCNHFMSADSNLYQVTQEKDGWDVKLLLMTSI